MRHSHFPGFISGCLILTAVFLGGCGGGDSGDSTSSESSSGTNSAPTISGSAGSAVAGESYSFQPSASDADGDDLSFTVSNLPSWASFSTSTGRISGTPTTAQIGSYGNISITASDGTASTALGPFSITVIDAASATGTATLSWTPPTTNSDGSSLTNLTGYRVMYGRSSEDLDQTVTLDNPSLNTYMVENLSSGTWYFAVVSVNSAGATSALSNTANKTIS